MKTAYLEFSPCNLNDSREEKYKKVGNNTGNLAFDYGIKETISCTPILVEEIKERESEFDNLVVRNFIWIKEGVDFSSFKKVIDNFKGKPIIPLSVGLQSDNYNPEFYLHDGTVRVLKEISEQSCIAVRGDYTAEILNKYGINNLMVVGCPSMYLGAKYGRRIVKQENIDWKQAKIVGNYGTLADEMNNFADISILNYILSHSQYYIEQTKCYFSKEARLQNELIIKEYVAKRKEFFNYQEWYKFVGDMDFSIGARFHGNVIPILSGVPSLVITHDSRTKELTDFFSIPSISVKDFDINKPIEFYYELANYDEFNKKYDMLLDNYMHFCIKNHLELKTGMFEFMYRNIK